MAELTERQRAFAINRGYRVASNVLGPRRREMRFSLHSLAQFAKMVIEDAIADRYIWDPPSAQPPAADGGKEQG